MEEIKWLRMLFCTFTFTFLNHQRVESANESQTTLKHILLWTPKYVHPFTNWLDQGQNIFVDQKCTFTNCHFTNQRDYLDGDITKFDAIIFNGRNIYTSKYLAPYTDLPTKRSAHQKYIFLNMESAENQPVCEAKFDGFFNWTMTYKLNSDFVLTYIRLRNKAGDIVGPKTDMTWLDNMSEIDEDSRDIIKEKSKAVAWLVSNCKTKSNREKYSESLKDALKSHNLTLDIYGKCGTMNCTEESPWKCFKKWKNEYFFYLAFENSFAEDYVTEAVPDSLSNLIVPIVYGGANYSRFLPPGSYLDAKQYSPEHLASMISNLINSPAKYYDFFRWTNHYTYSAPDRVCGLCTALNNDTMLQTQVYQDLRAWWSPNYDKQCSEQTKIKHILLWTPKSAFPFTKWWNAGQKIFIDQKCSFTNCYFTNQRGYLDGDITKFDAVIFNGRDIKIRKTYTDFPNNRTPHQKYIFLNMESADNQPVCNPRFDGFFNWTMTYKLNSDILLAYLQFRNKAGDIVAPKINVTWLDNMSEVDEESKDIIKLKSRAVAWFVSDCNARNKREKYAESLQKALGSYNLTLDIYGKCGSLNCSRAEQKKCDEKLKNEYFFYLSFENSFADDYVTEKPLHGLLNHVVPIVYGGANYSKFLPPDSYLDARQYTPENLASIIADLISCPTQYYKFFRWRNHYTFAYPDRVCDLCAALNNERVLEKKEYQEFRAWWYRDHVKRCSESP